MYNIKKQNGEAILNYLINSSLPSGEVQKIIKVFQDSFKSEEMKETKLPETVVSNG